jgi:hypothetical protein
MQCSVISMTGFIHGSCLLIYLRIGDISAVTLWLSFHNKLADKLLLLLLLLLLTTVTHI